MRSYLFLLLALALLSCNKKEKSTGNLSISGAFALYPLAQEWKSEFLKNNNDFSIDISAGGAGKGITDLLAGFIDIAMVSRELNELELKQDIIAVPVAKDAVVCTINSHNPFINQILNQGLTIDNLKRIFFSKNKLNWNDYFQSSEIHPINVYTRSDACGAAEVWASLFHKHQEEFAGIGVYGDPGVISAIQEDIFSIGYNNISYVYDNKTKMLHNNISVLPIDFNSNGKIDFEENFYDNLNILLDAIKSGKYPTPPARYLYFVLKQNSENKNIKRFINYILNDGQELISNSGYVKLSNEEIEKAKKIINE